MGNDSKEQGGQEEGERSDKVGRVGSRHREPHCHERTGDRRVTLGHHHVQ